MAAKKIAVHKKLSNETSGVVGFVSLYPRGWLFTSNVASHSNGRRYHDKMEEAVPAWVGHHTLEEIHQAPA